ncbi:hypothetical protein BASA83_012735 [Batrachochytrium salamandrivorans]|nr:hypothetical protein BASA83_012735 [Batrachochytrium salamandrivorans]
MPTTFFIDCGADDVFMDAELADRLNIPLVKIPVPIKLRLADGDSSSMITHRTLPLQLHIGLGKPPRTSDISPKPSIPEQEPEPSDRISDSSFDSDINPSLFKDPGMDLDLGIKKPVLRNSSNTLKSVSFAETIQSEVYPFLEASPVSETPIPPEIYKEFSSVFSESKAEILPLHRSFDCTINLSSSAEPSYGRIYQLTREEDKQKDKLRLCMDYRGLNKQTIKDRNPIPLISEMLRTLSTGKIFTTLDLRGAYNLLRIKEGDESKTAFITKYGQFEFLVMPLV